MAQIHWLSGTSGSFTNDSDWDGGAVPGAADEAVLGVLGSSPYAVTASPSLRCSHASIRRL
jgi:hypothetical protein